MHFINLKYLFVAINYFKTCCSGHTLTTHPVQIDHTTLTQLIKYSQYNVHVEFVSNIKKCCDTSSPDLVQDETQAEPVLAPERHQTLQWIEADLRLKVTLGIIKIACHSFLAFYRPPTTLVINHNIQRKPPPPKLP